MVKLVLEYNEETLQACKDKACEEVTKWIKESILAGGGKLPGIQMVKGPPPGMTDDQMKALHAASLAKDKANASGSVLKGSDGQPVALSQKAPKIVTEAPQASTGPSLSEHPDQK